MESVPDKLRVLGTGFGRAVPSHGRGHWFNPSRAHHFTLGIQRPVAVVPDCLPQEPLLDTLMTQLRSQNGYDSKKRQPL